jgi:CheY-like chemotaxis protein/REP element-mobilizing transposase RayT
VIDSSPDFADLIRQVLGESGQYDILAAHTANEGLDIIQEGYVRLAIVDFDLPDVNGADLVVEMRTVYPSLAVIAIPLSNTVDSPELEGLPIEGVLTKPFFPPHLPQIINDALSQVGFKQELDETAELVDPSEIVTARFDEDALIDEIQDLFEDQDFAPTEYPSQYEFEEEAAPTADLESQLDAALPSTSPFTEEAEQAPLEPEQPEASSRRIDPSAVDTQEHEVVKFERPSPFADGEGWVDMGEATVDPSAETSELQRDVPPVEAQDEWVTVSEAVPLGPPQEEHQPEEPKPEAEEPLLEKSAEPQAEPPLELPQEPEVQPEPDIPDSLRMGTREFASRLDVLRQSAPDAKAAEEGEQEQDKEEAAFPQDAPSFEDLVATIRDDEQEEISLPESSPLAEEGMTWVEMMAQQSETAVEPEAETEGEDWFDSAPDEDVEPDLSSPEPAPAVEWSFDYDAEPSGLEEPIQAQEPHFEVETTAEPMQESIPGGEPAPVQDAQVETETIAAPPPWLDDVDRAAQYLTRLSLETSAVAALLTRGTDLWAYAGELTQAQVRSLTSLIAEFWDTEDPSRAIARFISLPDSDSDFMFYGTHVAGGIVLSLVFSAETPFGMIRRQAQSLARTLSEIDPSEHVPSPVPEPQDEDEEGLPEFDFESEGFQLTPDPSVFFSDLDLPSPDPDEKVEPQAEVEESFEEQPKVEEPRVTPIPSDWVPDRSQRADHLDFLDEPSVQPAVEETLPTPATKVGGGPLPKSDVDMSFSLVLVPRFPEHRLTGSLAEGLHRWVERLCLAWDWRADNIEIEPAYVAVTLTIPPEAAPSGVVSQLRDDLSQRVLEGYPELARDLPSGRFWARGFLLKAGSRPKDEHIQAFILQTRRAQGLAS